MYADAIKSVSLNLLADLINIITYLLNFDIRL